MQNKEELLLKKLSGEIPADDSIVHELNRSFFEDINIDLEYLLKIGYIKILNDNHRTAHVIIGSNVYFVEMGYLDHSFLERLFAKR